MSNDRTLQSDPLTTIMHLLIILFFKDNHIGSGNRTFPVNQGWCDVRKYFYINEVVPIMIVYIEALTVKYVKTGW